jgi:hypothetical protein
LPFGYRYQRKKSECGEATLILQPDSKWEFVQTRQPTLRTVPFNDSTLAEVLQLVMRV